MQFVLHVHGSFFCFLQSVLPHLCHDSIVSVFAKPVVFRCAGNIAEDEAERLGLVPSHAYAVLDVKEVNGTRLLQVQCQIVDYRT